MNCDDAFDRMTVAGAAADEPLQRHLSHCRRCRAMQETLSPAMEWLSTAKPQPEIKYASGEHQAVFLTEEAVQVAERAAQRLSPASPGVRRRIRLRNRVARWIALAGMAMIGLLAIVTPSSPARTGSSAANPPVPAQINACLWTGRHDADRNTHPAADQVIASCVACHFTLR